ncbi:MAG: AAA family ATPase [Synergistales bacterium]|nr:AAA family ATPase [Synergistales bacterium]
MTAQNTKELQIEQLRRITEPSILGFETTEECCALEGLIGQERANRSMKFGLGVRSRGYNIFVVGNPGSGRTTYTLQQLHREAEQQEAPDDWIYVYNFNDPSRPLAINLPAGNGEKLSEKLAELVEDLKIILNKAFEDSNYEDQKAQMVKEFQEKVNELMEQIRAEAAEKGFAVKRTPQGFVNIPMKEEENEEGEIEKREMQQEEFEQLDEEQQKQMKDRSEQISQQTLAVLRKIRSLEKELKDQIKELEAEISRNAITPALDELRGSFGEGDKLSEWINSLTEDIIANANMFVAAARDENAEIDFSRYNVNIFVSNDPEDGAPVIFETNPNYYNTVGKVEYESKQGYLSTDFQKIQAGAMHKANGGYLLLQAEDLFRQFMSWEAIKRVLKTGEIAIENLGEQLGLVPVSSLRPEPVPIKLKVVIIGTRWIYYLLHMYDHEFPKFFKIKADFDVDMRRDADSERDLGKFVAGFTQKESLLPFSSGAVAEIIEWSSRLSGNRNKMSTQFNKISEILVEASSWARMDDLQTVSRESIRKAIDEKQYRTNLIEERIQDLFAEGTLHIATRGREIGQVNGLTVLDTRDHVFGKPVRITANVFMGREGVVNLEREVKMTGPIHNKGLLTLESYLGRTYAKDLPLSLSAKIAFEQTYEEIEGDSASSTELYCLLSALAERPLRQDIAVTGSVDQFGNIQPIGGVNEKIEGYFKYCKLAGLTGDQGVLVPSANMVNLMLHHEVLDAVREGTFHIWAIDTIEEGIALLTGIPAVSAEEGEESIRGLVAAKLWYWVKRNAEIKKQFEGNGEQNNEATPEPKDK